VARETVLVFADPACELHENDVAYVEAPERFGAALRGGEEAREAGVAVEYRDAGPAPSRALEAVHGTSYLERLGGLAAKGGGTLDFDTAMGPGSLEAATAASGSAIAAVEGALSGAPSYAVVRPPGHHAGPDYAMGFCLLNHAAVAAEHARRGGVERVAILDWDVHHGNGTQDIFYRSDGVLYLSVHRAPPFYPGTGEPWETGKDAGEGLTANVALPGGTGEDIYARVFSGLFLPLLREFCPGLLVISAGYDAHFADPLGGMRLSDGSFGRFAATLAALCREMDAPPPALVMEGGYNLDALAGGVAATLRGLVEEHPPEDPSNELPGPVAESRRALAPFWEGLR
jgi:acetoin utilization deacetylase AcuC-like enzyme